MFDKLECEEINEFLKTRMRLRYALGVSNKFWNTLRYRLDSFLLLHTLNCFTVYLYFMSVDNINSELKVVVVTLL